MKQTKRIISVLTSAAMCLCLFGCGSEEKESYDVSSDVVSVAEITEESRDINETEITSQTTKEYNLDKEYSFDDITFNVSSEWELSENLEKDSKAWYANDSSFIQVSIQDYPSNKFEYNLFIDGFKTSVDEIIKYDIIPLFGIDNVLQIEFRIDSYDFLSYFFVLDSKLYSIGYTAIIENDENSEMSKYFDDVIDSVKISENTITTTELPTELETENTIEKKVTAYPSGMYKVGSDMPAGEYMLYAESASGYLCVSSDANQDDIIFNENFGNNLIATFEEGEYVDLSRCIALKYDELPADIDESIEKYLDEGAMYKIGTNLKAGEYKLEATSEYGGYYCVYSSSRHDDIISNDNFDNNTYVNVSDGEYLLLSRCKIIG